MPVITFQWREEYRPALDALQPHVMGWAEEARVAVAASSNPNFNFRTAMRNKIFTHLLNMSPQPPRTSTLFESCVEIVMRCLKNMHQRDYEEKYAALGWTVENVLVEETRTGFSVQVVGRTPARKSKSKNNRTHKPGDNNGGDNNGPTAQAL